MMKSFRGVVKLFLLVAMASLVFMDNVQAAPPNVVVADVQVGGSGAGTTGEELVSIYNNSEFPVEVTNWCVQYSSASGGVDFENIACLQSPNAQTKLWLPASSYAIVASQEFSDSHPGYVIDGVYQGNPISSISGHIRIINAENQEVDRVGYDGHDPNKTRAAHPEGEAALFTPNLTDNRVFQRKGDTTKQDTDDNFLDFTQFPMTALPTSGVYEEENIIDVCPNIDDIQASMPNGYLADVNGNCQPDQCLNAEFPGLQTSVPEGYESLDNMNCTPIPPEDAALVITELLPNAASIDTGKEFVEIYNPNSRPVNLKDYKLELGPGYTKNYSLHNQTLAAGDYASFSDTQTGIVLPNSNATLRLSAPAGNVVDETNPYDNPGDDMAWILLNNTWQYTNQPTPGAANAFSVEETPGIGGGSTTSPTLEPCPAGKFRNPATNRCKNIAADASSLTPCVSNQYRNPSTNRCRLISSASSSLKPCRSDQRRNPATNRCKSIFSTGSSLTPCKPGQARNPATNRCRSTSTASSSLKPCAADQFRNPATNRCKKTGSAGSALKPCAADQARNPATNRCRKKAAVLAAQSIKDVESQQKASQTGWLLAGGAAATIGGYGAWEWRSEMMSGWRRLVQIFGKSPPID